MYSLNSAGFAWTGGAIIRATFTIVTSLRKAIYL